MAWSDDLEGVPVTLPEEAGIQHLGPRDYEVDREASTLDELGVFRDCTAIIMTYMTFPSTYGHRSKRKRNPRPPFCKVFKLRTDGSVAMWVTTTDAVCITFMIKAERTKELT